MLTATEFVTLTKSLVAKTLTHATTTQTPPMLERASSQMATVNLAMAVVVYSSQTLMEMVFVMATKSLVAKTLRHATITQAPPMLERASSQTETVNLATAVAV
jgi:hypothetical protein